MNINKLTASHIKDIRNKLGFTIEYVADKLGVANSTYSAFENGHTDIHLSRIVALATVFEMPWPDLLPINNTNQTFNGHNGVNGNNLTNTTLNNNFFANNEDMLKKLYETLKLTFDGSK